MHQIKTNQKEGVKESDLKYRFQYIRDNTTPKKPQFKPWPRNPSLIYPFSLFFANSNPKIINWQRKSYWTPRRRHFVAHFPINFIGAGQVGLISAFFEWVWTKIWRVLVQSLIVSGYGNSNDFSSLDLPPLFVFLSRFSPISLTHLLVLSLGACMVMVNCEWIFGELFYECVICICVGRDGKRYVLCVYPYVDNGGVNLLVVGPPFVN